MTTILPQPPSGPQTGAPVTTLVARPAKRRSLIGRAWDAFVVLVFVAIVGSLVVAGIMKVSKTNDQMFPSSSHSCPTAWPVYQPAGDDGTPALCVSATDPHDYVAANN